MKAHRLYWFFLFLLIMGIQGIAAQDVFAEGGGVTTKGKITLVEEQTTTPSKKEPTSVKPLGRLPSTGEVAAKIVGVVGGIGVLIVFFLYWLRKKKQQEEEVT